VLLVTDDSAVALIVGCVFHVAVSSQLDVILYSSTEVFAASTLV